MILSPNKIFKTSEIDVRLLAWAVFSIFGALAFQTAAEAQQSTSISTADEIESRSGGFKFPDGTVQSTAAVSEELAKEATDSVRRLTVSQGLYDNRIEEFTHARAFAEVCFKNGSILSDQNPGGTSTTGGECVPGDVGWILEADNRLSAEWTDAKDTCLRVGMRLPEIFEFQFSCRNATSLGLNASVSGFEWMMNAPKLTYLGGDISGYGPAAMTGKIGSCENFDFGFLGGANVEPSSQPFRCAL